MAYEIRDDERGTTTGDAVVGPAFRAWQDGKPTGLVFRMKISRSALIALGIEGDNELLGAAFRGWMLRRVRSWMARPDLEEDLVVWTVGTGDEDDLAEIASQFEREKDCVWLRGDSRDQYCVAASSKDQTAEHLLDGRRAAPTSPGLCGGCAIPPEPVLCSMLMHPAVVGIAAGQGIVRRQPIDAMCRLGSEKVAQIGGCCSGGHDCWRLQVEEYHPDPPSPESGSLADALDHLDAVWRLAHGRSNPLVRIRSMSAARAVSSTAASREEVKDAVLSLADIIDQLSIPDELLRGSNQPDERGSLNMLLAWSAGLADDNRAAAEEAVERLKRIRRLRTAFAHSATQHELPKNLAAVGIAYPQEWSTIWSLVRSRAMAALDQLRRAIPDT